MHTGMFDGADPDFAFRVEGLREVVQGHVVGLGRAAGPDDVGGMATHVVREFFAGFDESFIGGQTEGVRAGGIAVNLLGSFEPSIAGLAHDGRGGVVIKVKHRSTG